MKSGAEILRELAFKKPGTIAMGFIIYPVHNDPKNLKNLRHYDIIGCSWEEALEKVKDCRTMINKYSRPVMIKVIMEVIELEKGNSEIELPLPDLKDMTRRQREFLEGFIEEAQQVIYERQKGRECAIKPYAATQSLLKKYRRAIEDYNLAGCDAIKKLEKIFSF